MSERVSTKVGSDLRRVASERASLPQGEGVLCALEVGTGRIACALAELGLGRPRVVAADSVPSFGIRNGEIVDLARAAESIGIALDSVAQRAEADIRSVVLGFAGDVKLTTARGSIPLHGERHTVTDGDVARLRDSLHPESPRTRRVIHRFDGPYKVGDQHGVDRPVGLSGASLGMASSFITAGAGKLNNLLKAVRMCGVEIENLAIDPVAASHGALTDDERALGAAVLDFGAGGFRGALWEGGRLHQVYVYHQDLRAELPVGTAPSPDGMEGVVLGLARHFRVSPSTARHLLREHGFVGEASCPSAADGHRPDSTLNGRPIEVAAVDELKRISIDPDELAGTIKHLLKPALIGLRDGLSKFGSSHAGGVVLVGQGARLAGLASLTSKLFGGAPVRVGVPRWEAEDGVVLPPDLEGAGGCGLCGLIALGQEARARLRQRYGQSLWGRVRMRLMQMAAAL